ncbi:MAG: 5'-nucleotidase, lipoprotein e(P4) family [Bacteroidales bacterium]|nr:5'-nucleotidase, lipoprotein e(P4) family [Bacteroidales bacterium]MCF8403010.1 5'-nucleotidase, lipoprotein e(P4) family [Bacteroidales bacterium]
MKNLLIFLLVIISTVPTFQGCKNSNAFSTKNGEEPEVKSNDHLLMATLYQQTAAEYRALCYQAFNLARYQVDRSSKIMGGMKKQAIVVDIDETMLDNSPYEAKCILDSIYYPEGWDDWMNLSSAEAVPGALEFLKYAESKGVEVYYISNRKEKYRAQTLKNLQALNFPFANDDHLMLKGEISSKTERRNHVSEKNMIIMLIGDNLNDFSDVFEKKSIAERFELTDKMKEDFGRNFIVLPNAMYGEWEGAIYNYDYSKSNSEKFNLMYEALKGF